MKILLIIFLIVIVSTAGDEEENHKPDDGSELLEEGKDQKAEEEHVDLVTQEDVESSFKHCFKDIQKKNRTKLLLKTLQKNNFSSWNVDEVCALKCFLEYLGLISVNNGQLDDNILTELIATKSKKHLKKAKEECSFIIVQGCRDVLQLLHCYRANGVKLSFEKYDFTN